MLFDLIRLKESVSYRLDLQQLVDEQQLSSQDVLVQERKEGCFEIVK